jgi:hypothetical protein
VAQWESVRFTRGRSLVRSQPGPHISLLVKSSLSRWVCPVGYPSDVQTEASVVANASTSQARKILT